MLAPVRADWSSGGRLPGIRPDMGRVSGEDITVAVVVRAVAAALVTIAGLTGKPFATDDDAGGRRPSVAESPPLLTGADALLLVARDDEEDGDDGCGGAIVMVDSPVVDFRIIGMMIFCGTVTVRMIAVQSSDGSWLVSSSSR